MFNFGTVRPIQKIEVSLSSVIDALSAGVIISFLAKYAKWLIFGESKWCKSNLLNGGSAHVR